MHLLTLQVGHIRPLSPIPTGCLVGLTPLYQVLVNFIRRFFPQMGSEKLRYIKTLSSCSDVFGGQATRYYHPSREISFAGSTAVTDNHFRCNDATARPGGRRLYASRTSRGRKRRFDFKRLRGQLRPSKCLRRYGGNAEQES